jgi:Kinesin motor domain.
VKLAQVNLLVSFFKRLVLVTNEKELYPLLKRASENRAVAETQCNEHSSRSHR